MELNAQHSCSIGGRHTSVDGHLLGWSGVEYEQEYEHRVGKGAPTQPTLEDRRRRGQVCALAARSGGASMH
jgi:hypothetical protein